MYTEEKLRKLLTDWLVTVSVQIIWHSRATAGLKIFKKAGSGTLVVGEYLYISGVQQVSSLPGEYHTYAPSFKLIYK